MSEQPEDFDSIQDAPVELSAKELHAKRFQPRSHNNQNKKKTPLRVQASKPPQSSVKLKATGIDTHFKWALVLTILCFFIVAPCWALYKTFKLRRMIEQQELEAATRLSHRLSVVLLLSTIIGVVAWIAILFCSIGLLITGQLLAEDLV
jgi:hypothetical protein